MNEDIGKNLARDNTFNCILFLLNEALHKEREGVTNLIGQRVTIGHMLDTHPHIQVGNETLGTLGLINGICGKLTNRYIQAVLDDSDNIVCFEEWHETTKE